MIKVLFTIACFFVCVNVSATPVIDNVQALKQYLILLKQLKALKKQIVQSKHLIDEGKRVVQDAEGHYGFGNLIDRNSDFQSRTWTPDSWSDALKSLSGGNSSRYQTLLKAYQKDHYTLSDKQFSKGASRTLTENYRRLVRVNKAAGAHADGEYQYAKKLLKEVRDLMQKIETAPNTKAAMDLNSRLIAELSFISIEELRMQTLMNHQMAESSYDDIEARTREAIFNQLPSGEIK